MRRLAISKTLMTVAGQEQSIGKGVFSGILIEVRGVDPSGGLFWERTVTGEISEAGCEFHLKTRPELGAILAIRILSPYGNPRFSEKPKLFQVAWRAPEGRGWAVGVSKLKHEHIWRLAFLLHTFQTRGECAPEVREAIPV